MPGIYSDENGTLLLAHFVTPMTVRSNQPIFLSDTLSLRRVVTRRSAQRWEIETNLLPGTGGANSLFADIVNKGYDGTVFVAMPQNYTVMQKRKHYSDLTIAVSTATPDKATITLQTGDFMPRGTFFRNKNPAYPKVYMTTEDAAPGSNVVGIHPPNQRSVAWSATCATRDLVIGHFYYDTDTVRGMVYTDGIIMDNGAVKLVEKILVDPV